MIQFSEYVSDSKQKKQMKSSILAKNLRQSIEWADKTRAINRRLGIEQGEEVKRPGQIDKVKIPIFNLTAEKYQQLVRNKPI